MGACVPDKIRPEELYQVWAQVKEFTLASYTKRFYGMAGHASYLVTKQEDPNTEEVVVYKGRNKNKAINAYNNLV